MLDSYKTKINYSLLLFCSILYMFLFIWVVIFKCAIPRSILGTGYSLDPIQFGPTIERYMNMTIKERFLLEFYEKTDTTAVIIEEYFLNIIVFLPIGILLAVYIKKHKIILSTVIGFLMSSVVELTQLFTRFGGFSFIDLSSNTFGALFGSLIYLGLVKIIKPDKVNFAINIASTVVSIICIPIIIYACISIVQNIDVINYRLYY